MIAAGDKSCEVGIGTTSPQTSLDVNGGIRPIGAILGAACSPIGAQAYNSSTGAPLYCNGSVWTSAGGGGFTTCTTVTAAFSANSTTTATCSAGYTMTGGGYSCSCGNGCMAAYSYPSGNGWLAGNCFYYGGTSYGGTAYARCCQ